RSSSSINFSFSLSAIQPSTPITSDGFSFFNSLNSVKRCLTRCSAFSRMAQVFIKITSASPSICVLWYPCLPSIDVTISLSEKFMAQPYVSKKNFLVPFTVASTLPSSSKTLTSSILKPAIYWLQSYKKSLSYRHSASSYYILMVISSLTPNIATYPVQYQTFSSLFFHLQATCLYLCYTIVKAGYIHCFP